MYPRYYSQRGPSPTNPARHDVVPRELAAKIARERDMLYEELQRTQQAYKRGEQQRAELMRQVQSSSRSAAPGMPTTLEQEQAHKIRVLEEALADMTQQRDAAEYTARLVSDLESTYTSHEEASSDDHEDSRGEHEDLTQDEAFEEYSSHEDVREIISSMLDLRDSIERASAMSTDESNPWKQGLDYMVRQFDDILMTHGWTSLGEVGEQFDPTIHEAIGVHEAGDSQDIEVYEVSRRGFAHGTTGEILRPAQVIVSK